ncbi:MAG: alpha-(1-_3)-arabinofuranosyltransferase family protein [Acidimicrobiales bacterium]
MTAVDTPPPPVLFDEPPPPPAPRTSAAAGRAWAWYAARRWPTVVTFFVLALAATTTSLPGSYIGDSRFEMYASPARRLAKGLTIWDGSRGLGRVREDLWMGINAPLALLRFVGLDLALAERVWHAGLLAAVACGVVAVLRLFRPRLGPEHLVAGFAAAFGTYSLSFLTPFSDIYLQFALAPWLIVVVARGVVDRRPWRWAAAFALLIAIPGNVDLPGLVFAALPLLPLLVYLVFVERRVRLAHAIGFVARAGALSLLVSAAVLAKVYLASGIFGQRLNDTEAVEVSFRASSWSESLRGLGNWLSYFRDGGELLKPQGGVYFSTTFVVLCTFVPALVAVAYVWLSRWRPRLLFALMALTSLVVLVGAYPLTDPAPSGDAILKAFRSVALLGAFRNVYKAGPGLVIGVSILFGCGAVAGLRWLWRRSVAVGGLGIAAVAVVLAVNAIPFWTGGVYNGGQRLDGIPAYWDQAVRWLDDQPGDDRVLLAPMTSRTRYRWGWTGDDIFDALLARPHAVATGVPLSAPQSANLLEAVSAGLADPAYTPGTLAPVLRRMGIRYVLLRNDLDWQTMGRPRPASYAGLRNDPDLALVATFGEPGTNTTAAGDGSAVAQGERALPPVEIYALRDPGPAGGVRLADGRPPRVVAGDGAAWTELAEVGQLDGSTPVQYSGTLDPSELQSLLQQGAPLSITDTNRRRLRVLLGYEPDYSHTLAENQDIDNRLTQSLFSRPSTQSVAWYPDAATIAVSGATRGATGSTPWFRPANAFDRDPATEWSAGRTDALARTFLVQLRPHAVEQGGVTSQELPELRGVTADVKNVTSMQLRFSDGSTVQVGEPKDRLGDAPAPGVTRFVAGFEPRRSGFVEVRITGVDPNAATAGIVDLAVTGADLTEYVQVPDDPFVAALGRPDLAAALQRAPISYLFTRSGVTSPGGVLEEPSLRRRFRVAGERPYEVRGTLQASSAASDVALAALIDHPVLSSGPGHADTALVDGDPATTTVVRADEPVRLALPRQEVQRVGVVTQAGEGAAAASQIAVTAYAPSGAVQATSKTVTPCPGSTDARCRLLVADFAKPVSTDTIEVTASTDEQRARIRLGEVVVNNRAAPIAADAPLSGCRDIGLRIGEAAEALRPLPVQVDGTAGQLLRGERVPVRGCEVQRLGNGWHLVDGGSAGLVDSLSLATADVSQPSTASLEPPLASVDSPAPSSATVRYTADGPTTLVYQQSWAPGWEATVDGRPLGPPEPYDTFAGWRIDQTGPVEVQIRYRGQRIFDIGLLLTTIGVGTCLWLVLRRPRPPVDEARG